MKRFYKAVTIAQSEDGHQIRLDNRGVKTALGHPQILPCKAIAESMALEWDKQGEEIDPSLFRHRDLAYFAIDIIAPDKITAISKLTAFAETDTLCYRAGPDEPFYKRQTEVWEPLVTAFEAEHDVTLERVSGIIHKPLGNEVISALCSKLAAFGAFELAALQTMASLAASLCVGWQALASGANASTLWSAANLEEDWQIEQWGQDHEAEDVRKRKTAEFMSAFEFARLLREDQA